MATTRVRLGDIKPNPFRDLSRYHIDKNKVRELRESIRATGFWGNILCRRRDGVFEQAYGHHRLVALRDELGADARIDVIVQELDNNAMAQIMARENAETWTNSAAIDQETASSIVKAYAEGLVTLPEVPRKVKQTLIRPAPSFRVGDDTATSRHHPYTAQTLAAFLGWTECKTQRVLQALEQIEQGGLPSEIFQQLSTDQAAVVARETSKAKRAVKASAVAKGRTEKEAEAESRKVAQQVGVDLAKKLRNKEVTTRQAAETAQRKRGALHREEKKPVDLDVKAKEIAKALSKYLVPIADTNAKVLEEIIALEEYLGIVARRKLVEAIQGISRRAGRCEGQLNGQALSRR